MNNTNKNISTTFPDFLNINENKESYITLYHKVGGKQTSNILDRVKNVVKNGLIPHDPMDSKYSERGEVIWFSDKYDYYADKGDFVLSIKYNEENIKRFDMRFDGQYGTAYNSIPFRYLTVIKIPIIFLGTENNKIINSEFLIKSINKNQLDVQKISKTIKERNGVIVINLFENYVQPYINDHSFTEKLLKEISYENIVTFR